MTAHSITIQSDSTEQTQAIAAALAKGLRGGDVVALEGELGAGKTVFVRGLAEGLGIDPSAVASPTFVICQEHSNAGGGAMTLIHIDAYRLSGEDDLDSIGWSEMLTDDTAIIALEWPSRVRIFLPKQCVNVTIDHVHATTRRVTIAVPQDMADRIAGVVSMQATESSTVRSSYSTKCRRCGTAVQRTSPTFPFCSDRCRYSDLGKWFNEGYRVSREMQADDELED